MSIKDGPGDDRAREKEPTWTLLRADVFFRQPARPTQTGTTFSPL